MSVDEEKNIGMTVEDRETGRRQVQCADCLAWIDRDASHTCRQQVRRNQRGQKRGNNARQ